MNLEFLCHNLQWELNTFVQLNALFCSLWRGDMRQKGEHLLVPLRCKVRNLGFKKIPFKLKKQNKTNLSNNPVNIFLSKFLKGSCGKQYSFTLSPSSFLGRSWGLIYMAFWVGKLSIHPIICPCLSRLWMSHPIPSAPVRSLTEDFRCVQQSSCRSGSLHICRSCTAHWLSGTWSVVQLRN